MKLFLLRHGQTDWNLAGRFQGQSDIPLNETGRAQAQALGARLAGQPFDARYTSDLARAIETAQIALPQKPAIPDSRLREISFGAWEGLTYPEIQQAFPAQVAAWEADVFHIAPPGGESLALLAKRVGEFLNHLQNTHTGQNILLVAHGGVFQVMLCLALGLAPTQYWQFRLEPGSLSELAFYPAGVIVNRLNEKA